MALPSGDLHAPGGPSVRSPEQVLALRWRNVGDPATGAWGAGDWANVKWGSIYHALRALTKAGFLLDHDDVPGRTDYELTERGEAEFMRLLRDALRRPEHRPDLIGAGLAMLPALTRSEALRLLRERLVSGEEQRDKARAQIDAWAGPPHVRELFGLWEHDAAGQAEWTRALIARLEAGAYPLACEPGRRGRPGELARAAPTRAPRAGERGDGS
jgi:DNA-binding PadR family transcriptional regulator